LTYLTLVSDIIYFLLYKYVIKIVNDMLFCYTTYVSIILFIRLLGILKEIVTGSKRKSFTGKNLFKTSYAVII